jgi:hypothetical protein
MRARAQIAEALRRAHAQIQDRLFRYANRQYSRESALVYSSGVGVALEHNPPALRVKLSGAMPAALLTNFNYFDMRQRITGTSDPARFLRPGGLGGDSLEVLRRQIQADAVATAREYLRRKRLGK